MDPKAVPGWIGKAVEAFGERKFHGRITGWVVGVEYTKDILHIRAVTSTRPGYLGREFTVGVKRCRLLTPEETVALRVHEAAARLGAFSLKNEE